MKYQIFLAYVAVIMLTHQLCVSRLMINYYDKALEKEVWKDIQYTQSNFGIYPYGHSIIAPLVLPYVYDAR